jgi:hypothetical protein
VEASDLPAGLTGKWAWAGVIGTEDVDEHREAVRPWDLTIRQVSPGKYRAKTEYVSLSGILLYREQCNRRLIVTGATPAGYLVLGTPSAAETRIAWCGAEIHPGRLAFGGSTTEVDCVVPAGSHHVVALVPEDLPRTYLGEALGSKLSSSACRHLVCRPSVGESLIRLVHRLVDEYLECPELLTDREVCKAIESELLGILFQAVDAMDTGVGCVSARERYLAFLRAIKYTEHLQLPIGVAELAAAANVSRRVLESNRRRTTLSGTSGLGRERYGKLIVTGRGRLRIRLNAPEHTESRQSTARARRSRCWVPRPVPESGPPVPVTVCLSFPTT